MYLVSAKEFVVKGPGDYRAGRATREVTQIGPAADAARNQMESVLANGCPGALTTSASFGCAAWEAARMTRLPVAARNA